MKHTLCKLTCLGQLIIALNLVLCSELHAQNYSMDWAVGIGGTDYSFTNFSGKQELCYGMTLDDDQNVYITGTADDTTDFDPGPGMGYIISNGPTGIYGYVAKYDRKGEYIWARSFQGVSWPQSIQVDSLGNLYVTGYFEGIVDFDPGPGTFNLDAQAGWDIFIVKLDATGNLIWAKSIGYDKLSFSHSLAIDKSNINNIYITGYFANGSGLNDSVDFDPGPGTTYLPLSRGGCMFVLKLNSDGNYMWAKTMLGVATTSRTWPYGITTDASGNVLVAGQSSGLVDFDPGPNVVNLPNSSTNFKIFVCKLDSMGQFTWAKQMNSAAGTNSALAIATDATGAVYTTGYYVSTTDFDPGTGEYNLINTSSGGRTAFISKLDADGSFAWAKSVGSISGLNTGFSIAVSEKGLVYTSGYFMFLDSLGKGSIDFDPGLNTFNVTTALPGQNYNCLSILDTGGNFVWGGKVGPNCAAFSLGIFNNYVKVSPEGSIYMAGTYKTEFYVIGQNVVDFDPGPGVLNVNFYGQDDVFVTRLSPCMIRDTLIANGCDSYIFRNQVYTLSGQYTDTVSMTGICDSIITLDLTLGYTSSSNTLLVTTCDSYSFSGETYNVSGSFTHTFTNTSGCDSTIVLELTILGNTPDTAVVQTGTTLTSLASGATYQWFDCNKNIPVEGATAQSYTPERNGDYAVVVTGSGGCNDTSSCYTVTGITGIAVWETGNGIKTYPNPAQDMLTVTGEKPLRSATFRLVNVLGQVLWQQDGLQGSKFVLNLAAYAPGVYTLMIHEGMHVAQVKVIKE